MTRRVAAGEGYFKDPYLLWFVAGNPIRRDTLPGNIGDVARTIIDAARAHAAPAFQGQLDYALALVCSGRVARECGVQRQLIDILIDAGASTDCLPAALAHCEDDAAERLLERGARLTAAAAACLRRLDDLRRLLPAASAEERQQAFIGAAIHGAAEPLRLILDAGVDVDAFGPDGFHTHATALHQAVYSGSLDAVQAVAEAGADLRIRDRLHHGTPLGWATYLNRTAIARYLRDRGAVE